MKKILLLFIALVATLAIKAEQQVGSFSNSYFNKKYTIEAAEKNDKLQSVYIGVESKDSRSAFICVDGKNLELFKTALELVRDKYLEWVQVAKDNNVTEINKEFDIKFPSVDVAWSSSKWWFSFGKKINMKFIIFDDGKIVASWAPKVTSSTNRYIDEQIYFVFACEDDFNNLISQLNYQRILDQLLNTKNNEDLFK